MSGLPTSVGSELSGVKLSDVHLTVLSVLPKSPAELAGLKTGDKILNITNGTDFTAYMSPETVQSFVTQSDGKEIDIGYTRGDSTKINLAKIVPTLNKSDNKLQIGISMDMIGNVKLPFFRALFEGMRLDWNMAKSTAVGLYTLIANSLRGHGSLSSVSGPVGLVGIVGDAYKFGFVYLLSFTALISINLAIINIIPFPALDGGRLFFLLIEKIKGSRINPKVANTVNMIGFYLLIFLMLVITYHDVVKLF
jgi:regulator of sigma E protease